MQLSRYKIYHIIKDKKAYVPSQYHYTLFVGNLILMYICPFDMTELLSTGFTISQCILGRGAHR